MPSPKYIYKSIMSQDYISWRTTFIMLKWWGIDEQSLPEIPLQASLDADGSTFFSM